MIQIDAKPFLDKIQDIYYTKVYNENLEYYEKHGQGPYAYRGRFTTRIDPYLDAGYYHSMKKWLEKECNMIYDIINALFLFENEQDAVMFRLKFE